MTEQLPQNLVAKTTSGQLPSASERNFERLATTLDADTGGGLSRFRGVSVAECRDLLGRPMPRCCSPAEAVDFAEEMMKRMPTGPDTDRDIWLKDMTIVFAAHPRRDVEVMVMHPMQGMRARQKWLPTVDEVMAFLREQQVRRGRILTNARRVVADHDERAAEPVVSDLDRERFVAKWEEAKARMAANPYKEPVAGREPADIQAQQRRRQALADLDARRAAMTDEERAYQAAVIEKFSAARQKQGEVA